jgi:hypothetical protein
VQAKISYLNIYEKRKKSRQGQKEEISEKGFRQAKKQDGKVYKFLQFISPFSTRFLFPQDTTDAKPTRQTNSFKIFYLSQFKLKRDPF